MTFKPKFNFIGSFLSLILVSGGCLLSLNSCFSNPEPPVIENNGEDDPEKDPEDDPNENPDNPGTETPENPTLTSNIKDLTVGEDLTATAIVTAQNARGIILTDKAGSIYLYDSSLDFSTYSIGTIVDVTGTIGYFGTGLQLDSNATLSVVGHEEEYNYPEPVVYSAAMIDAAAENKDMILSTYVSIEGELNVSGNYFNVIIDGCSVQGSVSYPTNSLLDELMNGSTYTFTGYFTGISGGTTKYFNIVVTDYKEEGNTGGKDNFDDVPSDYKFPLSYVVLPDGTPQQIKEYTGFTLNYNKDNHTANFVSWELLRSETTGSEDRKNYNYWVDKDIEGCLDTDFAYSTYKYERGHMCPAADQKWSAQAMYDCMVMANMCPQLSTLNSGLWGTLENKEREWAKRDGALWIVAGPIYSDTDNLYIGRAKARVAGAYFKAFLYHNGENSRAIAFAFQNGSNPGNLEDYAMSIDDLEAELGYDFFSALPDEIENKIEATYSFSDWNK